MIEVYYTPLLLIKTSSQSLLNWATYLLFEQHVCLFILFIYFFIYLFF